MTTPSPHAPSSVLDQLDAIVAHTRLMPLTSPVAERFQRLLADPDTTLDAIVRVIKLDPSIAARLLRGINSAYYGLPEPVVSLERAIQLVGMAAVGTMIDTTSILRIFTIRLPHAQRVNTLLDGLWRHSVATGVAARLLASRVGASDPTPYFAAGLLHDIGKVALLLLKTTEYEPVIRLAATERMPIIIAEHRSLDFDHAQLGHHLCVAWGQSDDISYAVRRHHNVRSGKADEVASPMAAVVHVADILARALGVGWWGDRVMPRLDPSASSALHLQPDDAATLLDALEKEYPRALASLASLLGESGPSIAD